MVSREFPEKYQERMQEAQVYFKQGLKEIGSEILNDVMGEIEKSKMPEADRRRLCSLIRRDLERQNFGGASSSAPVSEADQKGAIPDFDDPSQAFAYGLALMDGQFWEDAVSQFRHVAVIGFRVLDAWEYCGDCCAKLEKWEEAVRYYEILYSNPYVSDDIKQRLLVKISKCSQAVRKSVRSQPKRARPEELQQEENAQAEAKEERGTAGETSLDHDLVSQLLGMKVESWKNARGACIADKPYSYRIVNLLQVGMTSLVVELEREETGERFAGQSIKAPFNQNLMPETLAQWTYTQIVMDSPYLVKIYDLAYGEDLFFIVRENFPISLAEMITQGAGLPLAQAVSLACQMLGGIGDLHLYMGHDKEIRKLYHLDLRPSRLLIHNDKTLLKINNGGLWKVLEEANPYDTAIRRLPLPVLTYRAPEQFRTYLARRKPPIFTDIYLFGAIFYEMLTGNPVCQASSYEEYEIQHCDQYPSPPKVWRPEIPEDLNDLVMKCLESDPLKRWRSATQLSLQLEKVITRFINSPEDEAYTKFIKRNRSL